MLAEQAAAAIGGEVVVLLPDGTDIEVAAAAPTPEPLDPSAIAAARWAWERGEAAGHGTGTLPQARWTFRPLDELRSRAGVAGIEAGALRQGSDEERLVLALLKQGAVAIERARLAGDAVETETLKRTDRFRGALTNSVSRDLRTPLSTVLDSATTLIDYGDTLKPAVRKDLLLSIREEAERLSRYVGDLLDMTRLEGGALNVRSDWIDARDVLNAAAARVSRRLGRRRMTRDFPSRLSAIPADQLCWSRRWSTFWRTPSLTAPTARPSNWPLTRIGARSSSQSRMRGKASRPPSWSECSTSSAVWRSPRIGPKGPASVSPSPKGSSRP